MRLSEEESIPVFCGAGVKITGRFWAGPILLGQQFAKGSE